MIAVLITLDRALAAMREGREGGEAAREARERRIETGFHKRFNAHVHPLARRYSMTALTSPTAPALPVLQERPPALAGHERQRQHHRDRVRQLLPLQGVPHRCVYFTAEQVRALMGRPRNLRHVSVIADFDDGGSTLFDLLVNEAAIIVHTEAGETPAPEDVQSTTIVLFNEMSEGGVAAIKAVQEVAITDDGVSDDRGFLINLLEARGNLDSGSGVPAALRVTDGALIVVGCGAGVCDRTKAVLRRSISDRIIPIVLMDEMDSVVQGSEYEPEALYQRFQGTIGSINAIIAQHSDSDGPMGDVTVSPANGTVAFGSGSQGWAFTLQTFAEMYARRGGPRPEKLVARLWGDNFYNGTTKKWSKEPEAGAVRGFNQYVLQPIRVVIDTLMTKTLEDAVTLARKMGVQLDAGDKALPPTQLLETMMRRWLPLRDTLLPMICVRLPSPVTAQEYRTAVLYRGPGFDGEAAIAMRNCDPDGPLRMCISTMAPAAYGGRSFGRVLSGRCAAGQTVRIAGPDYVFGNKEDVCEASILGDVPCGNICGVGQLLVETGAISTMSAQYAHIVRVVQFSVSPPAPPPPIPVQNVRQKLVELVAKTADERHKQLLADIYWTETLPRGVCLTCFEPLDGAASYGYGSCYREHRFCPPCAAGHELGMCPLFDEQQYDTRTVVVDGGTAYVMGRHYMEYLREALVHGIPLHDLHDPNRLAGFCLDQWSMSLD